MGGIVKSVGRATGLVKPDTSGQERAAANATQLQERMYEEGVERSKPFYERGVEAIGTLGDLMAYNVSPEEQGMFMQRFGQEQFEADPGYQFRRQEGEEALRRQLAAQGQTLSPQVMEALMAQNQGMASQEYNEAFNRYQAEQGNLFNRLASIAGMGQTQAARNTAAGQNMANRVGQIGMNLGRTQDMATDAQGQRLGQTLGTIAGGFF